MMSTSHEPRSSLPRERPLPGASRSLPWSAHEEKWLGLIVWFDWCMSWLFVIAFLGCLVLRAWYPALAAFLGTAFFAIDGTAQSDKYRAMMRNKPRSIAGLTEWIQLRPWQTEICCACGLTVRFEPEAPGKGRLGGKEVAPWHPNPVDPGGGRFSIVCPCGIGYFKLKA